MLVKEKASSEGNPNFDNGEYIQKQPVPRDGAVTELSDAVLYLASNMSSCTTGGVSPVDGGIPA
jgi:enoyl-[acyl-carrier-protein] reductase (NADH)